MRGRSHALVLAVCGIALPGLSWFGAAIVGLVTLRRGWQEGSMLILWASIPAIGWLVMVQEPGPLILLTGVAILAYILRLSVSWSYVLGVTVLLGIPVSLLFELTSEAVIEQVIAFFIKLSEQSGDKPAIGEDERFVLERMLVSLFTAGQLSVMLAALILARWWQSALYNPGGFGDEFRRLRLAPGLVLALVIMMVGCYAAGEPRMGSWILVLVVPLLVSGIALAHWMVNERKLGGNWLVVFYLLLLFFMQFMLPILAIVAVTDSWIDLRKKISVSE